MGPALPRGGASSPQGRGPLSPRGGASSPLLVDSSMTSGSGPDHRHQLNFVSLRHQHGHIRITSPLMALTASPPPASTRPQVVTCHSYPDGPTNDITKTSSTYTDGVHPHRFQASLWSGAPAWTTDTNTALGGITDHDGPLRRSNPESEPFLIVGFYCGPESGDPVAGAGFGGWVCVCVSSGLLLIVNGPVDPTGQRQHFDLRPLSHLSLLSHLPVCLSP